jgi:hypothetical protein
MTFFANSGVAWPNLEKQTQEAGAKSLDAGSRIWKILAHLENRQEQHLDRREIIICAESFQRASDLYSEIAGRLRYEKVDRITPAEIDLAAVNIPARPYYYDERFYYGDSLFYEMFLYRSEVSLGDLYRELAQRTTHLAASLRAFEIERENEDLAPQAFQLMKQWEILATLGRVVAVINRRSSTKGG